MAEDFEKSQDTLLDSFEHLCDDMCTGEEAEPNSYWCNGKQWEGRF